MNPSPSTPDAQQAQYLVHTDELTGLYNRRFYNQAYAEAVAKAQAEGTDLALIVIDVDFFKSINDRYGHQQGDAVLQGVGAVINETVGMLGYPIRYAGDEFSVLLPGVSREQAEECGAALCENVRTTRFIIESTGQPAKITFSLGVAHFPTDVEEAEQVFHCADHAAYLAKKRGRDGYVVYDASSENVLDASTLSSYFPCQRLIARQTLLEPLIEGLLAPADKPVQWAVVTGRHGYGKTRLLQDLRAKADTQRRVLLEASGLPYRTGQPYGFILEAVGSYLHTHPQAGQQVATVLSMAEIAAVSRLLPNLSRHVLLSTDAAQEEADVPDALCSLLLALGKGRSPSFLFDDFQRADQGSLAVMERLRQRDPLTFVCLSLRDDPDTLENNVLVVEFVNALLERGDAGLVELEPLTEAQVGEMVCAILSGADKHPQLQAFVWERSQGIPLMVEEVLKLLVLRGCLRYEGKALMVSSLEAENVPANPDDLMAMRAGQVEDDIRITMSRAAVIGIEFDFDTLKQLCETEGAYLRGILKRARKLHIATEIEPGDNPLHQFVSPQSHAAFYKAISDDERTRLHAEVAALREGQHAAGLVRLLNDLAFHYARGGRDEKSAQYRRLIGALFSQFTRSDALDEGDDLKDLVSSGTTAEEVLALAARAASAFRTCRNGVKMYGFEHVSRKGTFREAMAAFETLLDEADTVTYSLADGRLLVNGAPLPQSMQYGTMLFEFDEYGVKGVTFKRGLTEGELRQLLEALSDKPDGVRAKGGLGRILSEAGAQHVVPSETLYVAVSERDILLKRADGAHRNMVIKEVETSGESRRVSATDPQAGTSPQEVEWLREKARWQRELARYADPRMLDNLSKSWEVARQDLESGDTLRVTAASKLYVDSGRRSVGPLLELLAATSDLRARTVAASLLLRIAPDATDRVRNLLAAALEPEERANLIAVLGCWKDAGTAAIVEPYVFDSDRAVRLEAIRTLAACSEATLDHQLLKALRDGSDEVKADAITAIGDRGVFEAMATLTDLIKKAGMFGAEADERVQARACRALGQLQAFKAVPAVIAALARGSVSTRTKPAPVRVAAAMALERLVTPGNRASVEQALETATRDEEATVRSAAQVALGRVRST